MPATDGTSRDDLNDLFEACKRLADMQQGLAQRLHNLGLITDTTHLAVIAQADQLAACLDHARCTEVPPQSRTP